MTIETTVVGAGTPFTDLLDSGPQLVTLEEEDEHHLVHQLTLREGDFL